MLRSYALVVMDKTDTIIDRFNLDLVTSPSGNGFELQLDTLATDIEDVITNVTQKKIKITMTVLQTGDSYTQANILTNWLQQYSTVDSNLFLEYNDTKVIKYCGGKVTKLAKTERNQQGLLAQQLEFTMTTPFFIKRENTIYIATTPYGKSYPYAYPYSYGSREIMNNNIENVYINKVPIILTITGAIDDPEIKLLDKNGDEYSTVSFVSPDNGHIYINDGEKLIINSAQRKIYKVATNGEETDFRPKVAPSGDSFLFAKYGESSLIINIENAGEGFTLTGGWRQYTL